MFGLVIINIVIIALVITVYMFPTINAFDRKHHKLGRITALNVFLGWTFFGWLAALLWSVTEDN
ncbi:MAG: superinfection immunity protein [Chlorobiaceae bacterium]